MKTYHTYILAASLAGWLASTTARAADAPDIKPPPDAAEKKPTEEAASKPGSEGDKGLRLNFRGVGLERVLEYLSDAAGFIIVQETKVEGKVDVWSNQPLTKEEAVSLLNTILNKNGYAAIRNGRTLTIVSRDEAKKRDIRVQVNGNASSIQKSDEMVTQIIPVKHAIASQLTANLQPLLGTYAEMTPNESANTLIITATETDVKRMTEIINALDESISGTSTLKVFPLRYADAKELATVIKELFAPAQQTGGGGNNRGGFGGGGFGGFGGGQGGFPGAAGGFGGAGGGAGGGRGGAGGGGGGRGAASTAANTRVVAVADERSNSLVVGAPEDMMDSIKDVVEKIDQPVNDITELRVFHLLNADPMEMADLFAQLFPDETKSNDPNQNQQGFQFGRGGFNPFGRGGGGNAGRGNTGGSDTSQRMKKKGRVMAVPDQRTSSLIVSAASEMMDQIAEMVAQLDHPAKKQKVFVYDLQNADVQQAEQILRTMFERTSTQSRNNQNQNSPLTQRSTTSQTTTGTGSGTTGFGGSGSGTSGGTGGGRGQFP